jgi:predicted RNA binding protein YcfA (HicA-like mRNA interferase family)
MPHPHGGRLKARDILKLLKNDGWFVVAIVSSHRPLKHPAKPGRVTVSGHPADDIHPKTLRSILTQAGLKK